MIDKSGFFDLPYLGICVSPEHNVPTHIHIPQGKGYKHVCPMCGNVQTVIPHQVVYGIGAGWPDAYNSQPSQHNESE